jgi:hypothetical protein
MSDQIDIEQLPELLKHYQNQINTLKADFELLVRHCRSSTTDIISWSNQVNHPAYDQEEVMNCKRFVEKYGLRIH